MKISKRRNKLKKRYQQDKAIIVYYKLQEEEDEEEDINETEIAELEQKMLAEKEANKDKKDLKVELANATMENGNNANSLKLLQFSELEGIDFRGFLTR